ncbi:hypothetical protein NL505_29995, partial [Klebsiella pneumoniae]|nr:hypothetical protein [Klebsiella pneumoniae]
EERFALAGASPEITASGTPLQDGKPVPFPPLPEPEPEEDELAEEAEWHLVIESSDPEAVPAERRDPEDGPASPRES